MTTPAGVCRFCGCTNFDPCLTEDWIGPVGCGWTDRTRSVCTACAPAAKAEARALKALTRAGYRTTGPRLAIALDFVTAFHRGFVVGWFGISPRSPYGRNPFVDRRGRREYHRADAWALGQRAGAEASRGYQRVCGPLVNAPRKEILQGSGRR